MVVCVVMAMRVTGLIVGSCNIAKKNGFYTWRRRGRPVASVERMAILHRCRRGSKSLRPISRRTMLLQMLLVKYMFPEKVIKEVIRALECAISILSNDKRVVDATVFNVARALADDVLMGALAAAAILGRSDNLDAGRHAHVELDLLQKEIQKLNNEMLHLRMEGGEIEADVRAMQEHIVTVCADMAEYKMCMGSFEEMMDEKEKAMRELDEFWGKVEKKIEDRIGMEYSDLSDSAEDVCSRIFELVHN
eukprot:TRINITY_DN36513_c0_g1_i1.p1 TRINITY_DN36513_c0_g1~~TRINITY_DN36513_c0_g1_i1.p1  ORF type:complete len:249 (-),score=53.46 TRINITY_DN36513_c0_g1_i1:366-1112(-)